MSLASEVRTIICNELLCFIRSDRTLFLVYAVLVIGWGFLIASNMDRSGLVGENYWLIFFSVLVSGNFSGTVFLSERINGSLEILLTSGLSRRSILIGKILAVFLLSVLLGFLCYGLALITVYYRSMGSFDDTLVAIAPLQTASQFLLYCAACFMNAAGSAWFSCRIKNPRMLHFITLFILGILVTAYSMLQIYFSLPAWMLTTILACLGFLFSWMALRDFHSERIIHPIIY